MKILITGAKGFIGKNLISELRNMRVEDIYEYDIDSSKYDLDKYTKDCNFVFHLAGVNRSNENKAFMEGNFGFTDQLLKSLNINSNKCPIMIASSIQAEIDNPYGLSKKAGEDLLFNFVKKSGNKVLVYRFPNVFGKWCKPNYNSAVATFCHNIARNLPIQVNDPSVIMELVYIDDVVNELINALAGKENRVGKFCAVPLVHTITLGKIVDILYSYRKSREDRSISDMSDMFTKQLYSTYLSYLPENLFCYDLKMNIDKRGSFTEFIKTPDRGQISVNISKPGIVKGNHWHHTKNEKFLVVSGNGLIRLRKIDKNEVLEYFVTGDELQVVDIPPGYTHDIKNLGNTDLVTIMWANESFDAETPDTYYMEV